MINNTMTRTATPMGRAVAPACAGTALRAVGAGSVVGVVGSHVDLPVFGIPAATAYAKQRQEFVPPREVRDRG